MAFSALPIENTKKFFSKDSFMGFDLTSLSMQHLYLCRDLKSCILFLEQFDFIVYEIYDMLYIKLTEL